MHINYEIDDRLVVLGKGTPKISSQNCAALVIMVEAVAGLRKGVFNGLEI